MDINHFDLLLAPFETVMKSPGSWFVIAPVSIVAAVLELWPKFPSRYVYLVCLFLGGLLYPYLEPTSSIPASFPHPTLVLILRGFVLGFVAMIAHATLIKFLIKRLGAIANDTNNKDNTTPPNP